jgi:glyoxylase-like metal-dependent hydrolase (beta-lactamase superfamily II)
LTPYLEIGGDYREVLRGVYLLELPLPFSLGLVNVYLVRLADGWLLVDCGMETESSFNALDRAREGLGLGWTDIRIVLLTHIHPDHMGLTRRVIGLSGARLLLHHADARLLAEVCQLELYRPYQHRIFVSAGVAPEMISVMESSLADIQKSFYRLDPDVPLAGGETLETAAGTLQVIWTPGHSPGHVCLYDPARRALLSGDHILEHISPNIGWHSDHDALGEFLSSLDRIAALDVDLVLPSHGAPFTGHREWVAKTRAHHAERCDVLLRALDGQAKTAAQLIPSVWPRPLSPFHYRFALFEALAHLEHLSRTGRVARDEEAGVIRWRARRS